MIIFGRYFRFAVTELFNFFVMSYFTVKFKYLIANCIYSKNLLKHEVYIDNVTYSNDSPLWL